MKQLKITLIRSKIGILENQRATVDALGLRKIGSFKIHNDTPVTRGMLAKVAHLVKVEEI